MNKEQNIFNKEVENYIKNDMKIDIEDLSKKILNDVKLENIIFFNKLFKFMMELQLPYNYDNNLSHPNNQDNREFINQKLISFSEQNGILEDTNEYFIFDNIRQAFAHFKQGGIIQMYERREAECWYPKIIIDKFIGVKEDINKLEDKITIYRGTSRDEYDSGQFGQSWTLCEKIAKKFAFEHYRNQLDYKNTLRVVLVTEINNNKIFYYNKSNNECEVIIDSKDIRATIKDERALE